MDRTQHSTIIGSARSLTEAHAVVFSPRSLVGMTMGARKRRIRTERAPTRALLARFGITDQHAGYIERLCACKDPAAGHDVTCRADACSDNLPHSGDPCVVCESNDTEFAAHLGQADELLRLRAKYRVGPGFTKVPNEQR